MSFVLYFTSDWAEDRALLGSNPSVDPGAETGEGGDHSRPFSFLVHPGEAYVVGKTR